MTDEKGLYLLVTPFGGKLWRLKFRVNGKEKKLSLGAYPEISLKEARRLRDIARAAKADGADPAKEKQAAKIASRIGAANSFESLAEEYIDTMVKDGLAETTLTKARWFLSLLRPAIGREAITDISAQDMFAALKKVERAGHRETAKRLRSCASRVFRYAVATGRSAANAMGRT